MERTLIPPISFPSIRTGSKELSLEPSACRNELRELFVRLGGPHVYPAFVQLYREGWEVRDVYFVEEGVVKLSRFAANGREVPIGLRLAGRLLNVPSAILEREHLATSTTLTRCVLYRISSGTFLDILKTNLTISWHVHQLIGQIVLDSADRLEDLATRRARARLKHVLVDLASSQRPAVGKQYKRLVPPIKHKEIASLVGITPEYLSALLREMENEGLLRRARGRLVITDIRKLTSPAGE